MDRSRSGGREISSTLLIGTPTLGGTGVDEGAGQVAGAGVDAP
jgi:hypothetical protein